MTLLRAIPRLLLTLTVLAAIAAMIYMARNYTASQIDAYEREGPGSGLVRNIDAPWRSFNPDNLENQILTFYLNLNRDTLESPLDPAGEPLPFEVALGETGLSVSERLQDIDLIGDASLFRLYMRLNKIDQRLEAGRFSISPAMNMPEIAEALQSARGEDVLVRIPEGARAEEVARILDDAGVIDAAGFIAAVRTGDTALLGLPDYELLGDKPPGVSFEGYLFPDTYRLPVNATASDVLRSMFANLENRMDDTLRAQIASGGLTMHQVLTLASIVEREAVLADERPLIASTYRNRLTDTCAGQVAGYLQADPTAQYAIGYDSELDTWWPTVETVEEYLAFNSPYNTYLYPGLPPGPIAGPSLASVEAVVFPADTVYCYFVASSGGAHVFATTGSEHEINIQTYQR